MSDAAVLVKLEDRPSGRIGRVTVDNARKLNCLSTPLIVQLTQAFVKLADDRRCAPSCSPARGIAPSSAAPT